MSILLYVHKCIMHAVHAEVKRQHWIPKQELQTVVSSHADARSRTQVFCTGSEHSQLLSHFSNSYSFILLCVYVHMCMWVYAHACGGQRLICGVTPLELFTWFCFVCLFLDRVFVVI